MRYYIATNDMIEKVVDMRIEYVKAELGYLTANEETHMKNKLPSYYEKHMNKDYIVFFAQDGDMITGCACLHIIERPCRPQYPNGLIGEVLNVVTKNEYRHRGIASKLMEMLMKEGRNRGLDFIFLEATEDGTHLYEKLGWERSCHYTAMEYRYSCTF